MIFLQNYLLHSLGVLHGIDCCCLFMEIMQAYVCVCIIHKTLEISIENANGKKKSAQ